MPTEIEDQITSYFTWVEARTGFSLHAPDVEIVLDAALPRGRLHRQRTIDR